MPITNETLLDLRNNSLANAYLKIISQTLHFSELKQIKTLFVKKSLQNIEKNCILNTVNRRNYLDVLDCLPPHSLKPVCKTASRFRHCTI